MVLLRLDSLFIMKDSWDIWDKLAEGLLLRENDAVSDMVKLAASCVANIKSVLLLDSHQQ